MRWLSRWFLSLLLDVILPNAIWGVIATLGLSAGIAFLVWFLKRFRGKAVIFLIVAAVFSWPGYVTVMAAIDG